MDYIKRCVYNVRHTCNYSTSEHSIQRRTNRGSIINSMQFGKLVYSDGLVCAQNRIPPLLAHCNGAMDSRAMSASYSKSCLRNPLLGFTAWRRLWMPARASAAVMPVCRIW